MVATNYENAISRTLKWEGGYVNDPQDPGGETNWGITIKVARANGYTGSMRAMPLSTAKEIYRSRYAKPVSFDAHKAGVDYCLLDYGVNSGTGRANKVIRRVCGLADAAPFSDLLTAVNKRDPKAVVTAINDERLRFLQSLPTWGRYGKGWGNRVAGVKSAALLMAGAPAPVRPVETETAPAPQKGEVEKPGTAGPVIATGGGGVTSSGFAFGDWVSAHPIASVAIAIVGLVVIIAVAEFIAQKIKAVRQDAPTPGLVPVPELQH